MKTLPSLCTGKRNFARDSHSLFSIIFADSIAYSHITSAFTSAIYILTTCIVYIVITFFCIYSGCIYVCETEFLSNMNEYNYGVDPCEKIDHPIH